MLLDSGDKETERIRKKMREKERQLNSTLADLDKIRSEMQEKEDEYKMLKENCENKFNREKEEQKKAYERGIQELKGNIKDLESDQERLRGELESSNRQIKLKEIQMQEEIDIAQKEKMDLYNKNKESNKNMELWKDKLIQIIDRDIYFLSIMEERNSLFLKIKEDIWVPLSLIQKFEQKEILNTKNLVEVEKRISM